jgi:hypothetical protein
MRGAMSPLPHALWWRGACFSTRTNLLSRNVCIEVERKMAVLHVVSFESISCRTSMSCVRVLTRVTPPGHS